MVLFFVLFLIVVVLVERWSIKHSLDGVKYDVKLSEHLVEPEQEFEMVTTVRNASRRFIPFIRVSEIVPRDINVNARLYSSGFEENRARINSTIYMMPRQRMNRRLKASLNARGRYLFEGATLYGGDFLGIAERPKHIRLHREMVVLPRRVATDDFKETLGGFMGDISVNRFIMEDPVLTLGFREYTGREPMKQISWPVTARMGRMMVKNYDHTLDITVAVVLNVDSVYYGLEAQPHIEKCYSLARSVCEMLEDKHITYSFCTNAISVGQMGAWEYVSDGLGSSHLATILEGLGRANYKHRVPRDDLMDTVRRQAESGRAHIVITPSAQDYSRQDIDRLANYSGANVLLLKGEEVADR